MVGGRLARALLLLAVLALLPAAGRLAAQQMPLPVELQFSLFYRILSYDRNQPSRAGDGLVIGVVYQSGFRSSRAARDEAVRQQPPAAAGHPARFVSIDLDAAADVATALAETPCDVLYVTPLRAVSIGDIAAVSRRRHLPTLTGVPQYVESGLGVGVGLRDERPEIVVNLEAARAEGSDFSAQLLRLARVW